MEMEREKKNYRSSNHGIELFVSRQPPVLLEQEAKSIKRREREGQGTNGYP